MYVCRCGCGCGCECGCGCKRFFWKLMIKVLPSKRKHTVIHKITVDGIDITDPKDIANTLNSYFSNIPKQLLAMQNTCHGIQTASYGLQYKITSRVSISISNQSQRLKFENSKRL